MVACVFHHEKLRADRRQRSHGLRWLYAGVVLAQCMPLLVAANTFNEWMANEGFGGFFERFLVVHFCLIALLTPAMVGGAITEEKTSGTLQYLLTAYLSPGEIVLGKLLGRTLQLVLMSLAGLPVLCWFSGFGNLPSLPVAVLALTLPMIFGLAAMSLLASVECRQTRDAMLTVYALGLGTVLVRGLGVSARFTALVDTLNPLEALAMPNALIAWRGVGACALTWSIVGLFCLCVASLRLRGAYLRQLCAPPPSLSRWLPVRRPRIRVNPVLWRERHVVGLAPWRWLRRGPRWLGCAVIVLLTLAALAWALQLTLPTGVSLSAQVRAGRWLDLRAALRAAPRADDVFYWHGLAALLAATWVVAIRASGCIANERETQTWQTLLQTPMRTRAILQGKQWGILGACSPHVASYAVTALAVSLFVGATATAWTVVWLIATVFAMLFMAAVGIWFSARMPNAWLSLLATISLGYSAWLLVSGPVLVGVWFAQSVVESLLELVEWLFGAVPGFNSVRAFNPLWVGVGLGFVAAFWFLTDRLLTAAERHIDARDRGRDVDPQYERFYKRWLRQIKRAARTPQPIDAAILNEMLALASEEHEEISASMCREDPPKEDPDIRIPTPDLLGPAPAVSQGE